MPAPESLTRWELPTDECLIEHLFQGYHGGGLAPAYMRPKTAKKR